MSDAPVDLEKVRRAKSRTRKKRGQDLVIATLKPGGSFMDMEPGAWRVAADEYGLPPKCPVKPLGRKGDTFYLFNVFGGVAQLGPKSGRGDLEALFSGAKYFPCWAWPKKGRRGSEDFNFNVDLARADLFEACTVRQLSQPEDVEETIRGRGCWPDAEGLVVHLGDKVILADGTEKEPHADDRFVYPVRPSIDPPAKDEAVAGTDGPGRQLIQKLQSWNWLRPELDPYLLLGWLGVAFLGPAASWRPMLYIVGDAGTGKSQLTFLLKAVLGRWALLTTNATAPSIYRELRSDGIAVICDEAEGRVDNRRGKSVVDLAREAASGSMSMRASADGDGSDKFKVRSAFAFAAINMPPAESADYSRMALLQLRPIEKPGESPVDEREEAQAGAQILRRLINRYDAVVENVRTFRDAFLKGGHGGRGGDTFAELIGLAWSILEDDAPDQEALDYWAKMLTPGNLTEIQAQRANWEACLDQMFSAQPDVWRNNGAKSVGELFGRWRDNVDATMTVADLRDRLAQVGLGLLFHGGVQKFDAAWLFVPVSHPQTRTLFARTKWEGEPGTPGTWVTALRGAPDGVVERQASKAYIGGRKMSGVAVCLARVLEKDKDDGAQGG